MKTLFEKWSEMSEQKNNSLAYKADLTTLKTENNFPEPGLRRGPGGGGGGGA